jgi:hypothetical protein
MDHEITPEERAEALRILADDNGGAGLDNHTRAYFRFVAHDVPGVHPVRNETGGISGYRRDAVTADIERFAAREAEHLALAQSATAPEMAGAHEAVAQNYRMARLTREVDARYDAQTYLVAATGWENLMTDPGHRAVYTGKSQGMWPRERAQKDAAETEEATARLLAVAQRSLDKRLLREATAGEAAAMTDAELDAAVKATAQDDTTRFLVLVHERDKRSETVRKAKSKAQRSPASDDPWTAAEERMLSATAAQTAGMDLGQLQGYRDAFKSSTLSGRTRMDQLKYESVIRELALRESAVVAARELLDRLPGFRRDSGGFGALADQGRGPVMDASSLRRVHRMSLPELEAEYATARSAGDLVPLARGQKTAIYNYLRALRDRIRAVKELGAEQ